MKHRELSDFNAYIQSSEFVTFDLYRFLCGEKLGSGIHRAVYDYKQKKNCVIKIAPLKPQMNIVEFQVWETLKYAPSLRKWFAPCYEISEGGHFLIQHKVQPIKPTDKLPARLPDFMTDIKRDNFGWIGKQLVCVDYAFIHRAVNAGMDKMQKVDWNKRK